MRRSRAAPSDSRRRRPGRGCLPAIRSRSPPRAVTAPRISRGSRIGGSLAASSPSRPIICLRPGPRARIHQETAGGVAGVHGDLAGQPKVDVVLRHKHGAGGAIGRRVVVAQPRELEARPRRRRRIAALVEIGGSRVLAFEVRHDRGGALVVPQRRGVARRAGRPRRSAPRRASGRRRRSPQCAPARLRPRRARRGSRLRRRPTNRAASAPPSRIAARSDRARAPRCEGSRLSESTSAARTLPVPISMESVRSRAMRSALQRSGAVLDQHGKRQ